MGSSELNARPHFELLVLVIAAASACGAGQNTLEAAAGTGGLGANDDAGPGWDWAGIVGTGQSLSVGEKAPNAIDSVQPFENLKLSLGASLDSMDGPPYDADDPALSVKPLIEPIRAIGGWVGYPQNIKGET